MLIRGQIAQFKHQIMETNITLHREVLAKLLEQTMQTSITLHLEVLVKLTILQPEDTTLHMESDLTCY